MPDFPSCCSVAVLCLCTYFVVLVHAVATHFGLDVFADMFGGWQETAFRLKTKHQLSETHTHSYSPSCDFSPITVCV